MPSAASSTNATIPLPPTPLVDASGNISRPWLYFLLSLFNRTGGAQGISVTVLQQDIAMLQQQAGALFVEEAMADVPFPPTGISFSMDAVMSDETPPPSIAPGTLLTLSLIDDVPRAPLNPFLAAMMVS